MRSRFNWTTENIGLAIGGASLIVAIVSLVFPNIRCLIPIVNQYCPKRNCELLFKQSQKIEYRYRRGDKGHIDFGLVEENLDTSTPGIVIGEVYLLDHQLSGNTDIHEALIPKYGTQYPYSSPEPVDFQIKYKNDEWEFDYYYDDDPSRSELDGNGRCISSKKAAGSMYYPNTTERKGYSVFFERIE